MQKIEKWRVQELAIVLHRMAELLREGDNSEWANVVGHFYQEAQAVLLKDKFELDSLKRLILNINNCYSGINSFKNLSLRHDNDKLSTAINQEFYDARARLWRIIREIEKKSKEYKH